MTDLVVGDGTQVTLHFSLKLESGDVVDSNFDGDPATFIVGDGNLLPGFEQAIFGMSAGSQASLAINPENAFGQPNPNNIQQVPRKAFTEEFEFSSGLVITFADASGGEVPGVIVDFTPENVTVDFNHPLAGEVITFDVSILSVVPAVTH
ncbi:FKBP-type peptidyl-prolyl cis-trans isomerase [Teredinibacter haidensis]|uniref:FKBP-type peptidyl-prolyl cis-trans isomerase n=1 Tax=Teredinibacter haidensis TaxID=2731755 RepID=UPI0009488B86|nr:peptidylprolyl isomerase [Teredinibacter haidensis]